MFTIPTGGLSIFIYGFILIIGGVINLFGKINFPLLSTHRFLKTFVSQEGDCALRRLFSWSIAIILPVLLICGVGIALMTQIRSSQFPLLHIKTYLSGESITDKAKDSSGSFLEIIPSTL